MQLLIVDTAQIQGYIFGSNRLRENIGASYLVAQATGEWVLSRLPEPHNVLNAQTGELDRGKRIERDEDGLKAEVIYVGGGNVVILFADEPAAQTFTRTYSHCLLTEAPNLQVVVHHQPFDWNDCLYEAVKSGFRRLAQKKEHHFYSSPLLGLGVTEMCQSTAFPAVALSWQIRNDDSSVYPISAETRAKLHAAYQKGRDLSLADERLQNYMPCPGGHDYPRDFDDLGRSKGEQSYIAIIHADGDGIGQRLREVGKDEPNRGYIEAVRAFSKAVDRAGQDALRDTISALAKKLERYTGDQIQHHSSFGDLLAEIILQPVPDDQDIHYLPFRPIVFGGDDVTFVCDGRLGLSLALEYMHQFEVHSANLPDGRGKATASAGVAIVKSHYPFAQAYAISDELVKSAKGYRRENALQTGVVDWHFARSGVIGTLTQVRAREYTAVEGSLTLRPVTLGANAAHPHRAWSVVHKGVSVFQDRQRNANGKPEWSVRRNKVKALQEMLRAGPAAVSHFRAKYLDNKLLPEVAPDMSNWPATGWQGGYCGYFDALEIMDWFIPLNELEGEPV